MKIIFIIAICSLIVTTIIIIWGVSTHWNKDKYNKQKFFRECPGRPHIDYRFCDKNNWELKQFYDMLEIFPILANLTDDPYSNGPILIAGGLIGWLFNRLILPWDDDLDVFVSKKLIEKMWKKYGTGKEIILPNKTKVLVSVNPWRNRKNDKNNMIDARIIHMKTGIFIDVTYLKNINGKLCTEYPKDKFTPNSIWPAKKTTFGPYNSPIYVPAKPINVLKQRYKNVHVLNSAGKPLKTNIWKLEGNKYWLL